MENGVHGHTLEGQGVTQEMSVQGSPAVFPLVSFSDNTLHVQIPETQRGTRRQGRAVTLSFTILTGRGGQQPLQRRGLSLAHSKNSLGSGISALKSKPLAG
jgi:hypothetical protein